MFGHLDLRKYSSLPAWVFIVNFINLRKRRIVPTVKTVSQRGLPLTGPNFPFKMDTQGDGVGVGWREESWESLLSSPIVFCDIQSKIYKFILLL